MKSKDEHLPFLLAQTQIFVQQRLKTRLHYDQELNVAKSYFLAFFMIESVLIPRAFKLEVAYRLKTGTLTMKFSTTRMKKVRFSTCQHRPHPLPLQTTHKIKKRVKFIACPRSKKTSLSSRKASSDHSPASYSSPVRLSPDQGDDKHVRAAQRSGSAAALPFLTSPGRQRAQPSLPRHRGLWEHSGAVSSAWSGGRACARA